MTARLTYQVDVIGVDIADVVAGAGGWLFDRVMDGWRASVLVGTEVDDRALHVLGARAERIDSLTGLTARRPEALAVSDAVMRAVPQVREHLEALLASGRTEVWVWGTESETTPAAPAVRHRLSTAARAFKGQALAAAGGGRTGDSEYFHRAASGHRVGDLEVVC